MGPLVSLLEVSRFKCLGHILNGIPIVTLLSVFFCKEQNSYDNFVWHKLTPYPKFGAWGFTPRMIHGSFTRDWDVNILITNNALGAHKICVPWQQLGSWEVTFAFFHSTLFRVERLFSATTKGFGEIQYLSSFSWVVVIAVSTCPTGGPFGLLQRVIRILFVPPRQNQRQTPTFHHEAWDIILPLQRGVDSNWPSCTRNSSLQRLGESKKSHWEAIQKYSFKHRCWLSCFCFLVEKTQSF